MVAYKIFSDISTPLEDRLFISEALAKEYLERDPDIIAAMVEEEVTLDEMLQKEWLVIAPMEIISE